MKDYPIPSGLSPEEIQQSIEKLDRESKATDEWVDVDVYLSDDEIRRLTKQKKLEEIWMPYKDAILNHVIDGKPLVGVPDEAWKAYEKDRKWAWEQEQ